MPVFASPGSWLTVYLAQGRIPANHNGDFGCVLSSRGQVRRARLRLRRHTAGMQRCWKGITAHRDVDALILEFGGQILEIY